MNFLLNGFYIVLVIWLYSFIGILFYKISLKYDLYTEEKEMFGFLSAVWPITITFLLLCVPVVILGYMIYYSSEKLITYFSGDRL